MDTPPLKARLSLVELTARNTLYEAKIFEPPVPAKILLERHAVVHWFSDDEIEGFCTEEEDRKHIFLNRLMTKGRDNFTYAHELAHLQMNHLKINQSKVTAWHEHHIKREADYFAACLLMPEDWIRQACGNDTIGLCHLRGLVQIFDVSWEAMTNRLDELKICEKEYIKWMWDLKKSRR